MINKIKKLRRYLIDYHKNKNTLRILSEQSTTPLSLRHLELVLRHNYCHLKYPEQILSLIIISSHSIEKGLAISDKRYGFGQKKIEELINLCNIYLDRYKDFPSRLTDTLGVIAEYNQIHIEQGYLLPEKLQTSINNLLSKTKDQWTLSCTHRITKEEYFQDVYKDFASFSSSRHSVRDFDGTPVSKPILDSALQLAQNAPSACNRQATHVYVVFDDTKRRLIVDLQNHGRGFADNANPLLVITTEIQSWCAGEELFGGYIDAGIYIMNLLYALHFHKIAALPLNWYASIDSHDRIHNILNIPESHEVVALIACGNPVDDFFLVTSQRRPISEIITYC